MLCISCPRGPSWLLLATFVGLLGCPQLLEDGFSTSHRLNPDAGGLCLDGCGSPSAGAAGAPSEVGSAGTSASGSGAGGQGGFDAGGGGNAGSAGAAGAGSGGATGGYGGQGGGTGDAGIWGNGGTAGGGSSAACWTLELTDTTHDGSSNCVGITGWNDVTTDTGSSLSLSYDNGDPCFSGTIASSGWGGVYDLNFAPEQSTWNAVTHGVTGFNLSYRGANPPSTLKLLYKDRSGVDFCRVLTPGDVSVPFSDAHPNCSTSASSSIVDTRALVELILAFPVKSQAYAVDFCLQISALD